VATVDASHHAGLTVAIVGAECSGKTMLAEQLALRFGVPWVAEFARSYLGERVGYDATDVLAIARGQHRAELTAAANHSLLIADTDLVVIKVWWKVRFGGENPWVEETLRVVLGSERNRCYLLTAPDIPWIADPLRENPTDRPALHEHYRALLELLGVPYVEVSGSPQERLDRATAAVRGWLSR
jgi:nicotinamide riboside kinase